MKINLGCGESPLDGYINIDSIKNKLTQPDVIANIKLEFLPFKSYECEEICALHVLEHIERDYWSRIFDEFYRLLIPDGVLILAYPEFERCAHNFITNFKGARDFWRMTHHDWRVTDNGHPEIVKLDFSCRPSSHRQRR